MPTLRVSAGSRPNAVAGAIAALLRLEGVVEMQAIGPHAVNQAVKSLAIARSYLVQDEIDLIMRPSFVKLELHEEERTAMRFEVWAVPIGEAPAVVRRKAEDAADAAPAPGPAEPTGDDDHRSTDDGEQPPGGPDGREPVDEREQPPAGPDEREPTDDDDESGPADPT